MIATVQTSPFHVFGYARKGDEKQINSIEAQKMKIDKYYDFRFGDDPLATFAACYEDHAANTFGVDFRDRPHGRELNLKVMRGDHILLALGDRAFRSIADCCLCIKDWSERGVAVHYLNADFDTSTAAGRMMARNLASLAEYKGEYRNERQKFVYDTLRANGLPTNGNAPWGWKILGKADRRFVEAWSDRKAANLALHRVDNLRWSYQQVVEAFNGNPPTKARRYNGRSKPWTVWSIFQAVKAARANFPDPRERRQAS